MIARDDIHLHHHWTALGWIFPPEFYLRGSLVANRVYLQKANVEYQPEWFRGNERDGQYNFGGNGFLIPFLYDYKVRLRYEARARGPCRDSETRIKAGSFALSRAKEGQSTGQTKPVSRIERVKRSGRTQKSLCQGDAV